jgi:dihydrofolate reductase
VAKTIYYCAASLDGYIAESDDTIGWLTGYEGSYEGDAAAAGPMAPDGSYERFYAGVGALVSGSVTYEFVLEHTAGGSWPYGGTPYWVLSSRELAPPDDPQADVRVRKANPPDVIGELRAAAGDLDIWIVGGGNVASQFADDALLDELHVTMVPVVLGSGKPLFDRRVPGSRLQLLGTTTFGNGMVELRYAFANRSSSA